MPGEIFCRLSVGSESVLIDREWGISFVINKKAELADIRIKEILTGP